MSTRKEGRVHLCSLLGACLRTKAAVTAVLGVGATVSNSDSGTFYCACHTGLLGDEPAWPQMEPNPSNFPFSTETKLKRNVTSKDIFIRTKSIFD